MKTKTAPTAAKSTARDIYQEVTDRIISSLKNNVIPWKRDWSACAFTPRNWEGRAYAGINWLLLGSLPYDCPVYLTFNKAKELGGMVRKGEKGHLVTFWKFFKSSEIDPNTGKQKMIPMLRHYIVFNVSQCDGLPTVPGLKVQNDFNPIEAAENIVVTMENAPAIHHDGNGRCFYRPSSDSVHMTASSAFKSAEGYYSTLFHELVHSTGHANRLNRPGVNGQGPIKFVSEPYSREELVAELGAAFLCATTGISEPVMHNQAAYIRGWLDALQNDPKALIWAAGKAARAADHIQGIKRQTETDDDTSVPVIEPPATTAKPEAITTAVQTTLALF